MPRILNLIVAALAVAPIVVGHTWIEQLRNVDDKGKYVGEYGYPRGMVSKTDPGFDGFSMNWEIPAYQGGKVFIDENIVLCHKSQTKQVQSQDKYPRLKAVPGGFIAMRYMENGHITKPQNQKGKPAKAGTIFVYGTTEPKEDEKIVNVLQWTQDGKGGDGRGALITMNDFDDGRCYENNDSPIYSERVKEFPNYAMGAAKDGAPGNYPLFCETSVKLPESAQVGKPYTFYWVWQWNTASGGVDPGFPNGKDEYYSTCMDVDVTSADVALAAEAKPGFALGQQDAMSKAVDDFASRSALMTDAIKGEVGPYFSAKQTSAPSGPVAAPSQKPSAPASVSQAPAPSSKAPATSSKAPAPSSKAPAPSSKAPGQPAIPTLTQRPGAAPSSKAGDGSMVTVTDIVYVTVTGSAPSQSAPPAAVTSKRAISSVKFKPSPSGFVSSASKAPAAVTPPAKSQSPPSAASSNLPGFDMRNKNGAKFRGMFT